MQEGIIQKFLKNGKSVEQEFAKIFKNTEHSTIEQDMHEHWDVMVKYKIDVKGLKKIKRSDPYVNENVHWIEIMNVNHLLGWLYSEETDFFAFELRKYWIIVEKKKLQKFIADNVIKEFTNEPALYRLYNRVGRKDILTLVESFDLVYISECLIPKTSGSITPSPAGEGA